MTGAAGTRLALLRRFLAEKRDPVPFYEQLAARTMDGFPFPLDGAVVVDLGCGPGHYTRALRRAGAAVLPVDLDPAEFTIAGGPPQGEVVADASRLPVRSGAVDGVFCSNMLEHTSSTAGVLAEVERMVKPGGWVWLSWTNWWSPYGGHDIAPFHYLGPRAGAAVHRRVRRRPPKDVPGQTLFPLHIGAVLRMVAARPGLELIDAMPRYYPSQRWIVRVPGLREVATWNCLLLLRRTG